MNGPLCYSLGSLPIDGCTLVRSRGAYRGPVGFDPMFDEPETDSMRRYLAHAAIAEDSVGQKTPVVPTVVPASPLLTSPPVTITAAMLGDMVDVKNVDVATVVQNLNTTITLSKVTTALAEAMLIAQLQVESGGFTKAVTVESADSSVIYNPGDKVPAVSKQKARQSGRTERYLQSAGEVAAWRVSKAAYTKAQADYVKQLAAAKTPKTFDESGDWKITKLTDFVPGDIELPYWKKWYDPESPDPHRSEMAKSMKNITPGDGKKYVGRGYVQLTWRTNYIDAGKFVGLDLDTNPDLAADPANSVKISAWFWNRSGCNGKAVADSDAAFEAVTKAINGGEVGLAARKTAFTTIKDVLTKVINATPQKL